MPDLDANLSYKRNRKHVIRENEVPEWSYQTLSKNDIPEEVQWWESQNIPWQLVKELRRRSNSENIGQNSSVETVINFEKQHGSYRGPMTPWIRVFSNGTGHSMNSSVPVSKYLLKNGILENYDGFLFRGGDGFNNAYGFEQKNGILQQDISILGYQANGKPHYIDPTRRNFYNYNASTDCPNGRAFPQNSMAPSVLPPPGVVSINIKTNKDMMANATINWKCYSLAQLEYMTPFWLSPKINVFLEFGWNLYDNKSLLELSDAKECYLMIRYPQLALKRYYESLGNYGLITGIINKYNFSTEDGFVYNCNTEIVSRQAMYAGYRVDNPTTETMLGDEKDSEKDSENKPTSTEPTSTEYSTLKNFFTNYLQFAKEIIQTEGEIVLDEKGKLSSAAPGNYINYIVTHADELFEKVNERVKSTTPKNPNKPMPKDINSYSFYGGKKENRMFMGRSLEVYGQLKSPTSEANTVTVERQIAATAGGVGRPIIREPTKNIAIPKEASVIEYGTNYKGEKIISFADKNTDFDSEDSPNEEVWFQLDFVFEIINTFCADELSKNNKIDISDIIISAHPNLISCDKNVLIPNPRAPKVNMGRHTNGYLTTLTKEENYDNFSTQKYWYSYDREVIDRSKAEENLNDKKEKNPDCLPPKDSSAPISIWKAARKARNVFKTKGAHRDNLDVIINKLYYSKASPPEDPSVTLFGGSAAFPVFIPLKTEITAFKVRTSKRGRTYTPGYFGYLKHLYISKSKLIEIGRDESLKTLQQLVNKILNTINEAVDNFWNLEIVDNPHGGLSVIDKNLPFTKDSKIYMFDLASTNNVIKKINFDVTLTNEQTNQVLYGSGQNAFDKKMNEMLEVASDSTKSYLQRRHEITQIKTGLPSIVCADRFDNILLQKDAESKLKDLSKVYTENPYPPRSGGPPRGPVVNKNIAISDLQSYANKTKDVLIMCVSLKKYEKSSNPPMEERDWVCLNLPPTLKDKLREMLDDGDTTYNAGKYTGPADNFTISLTFDGIMGFRMFQHFAISNLPKPYVPGNVIFMVSEVEHQINAGKWETVVTAMLRCAPNQNYEYITI